MVRSLPGLGTILGARVLGEFGDEPNRYATAKCRKNYAGTSPITRASGTKRVVLARHVRNHRLADAIYLWAFAALSASPGPGPTTTPGGPPATPTTRRCGPSATASSASSTAASPTTSPTTRPSPGATAQRTNCRSRLTYRAVGCLEVGRNPVGLTHPRSSPDKRLSDPMERAQSGSPERSSACRQGLHLTCRSASETRQGVARPSRPWTRFISLPKFFWLAEQVTGIDADVLETPRSINLADSALHAPQASFGGQDFYPDLIDKAAVLACATLRGTIRCPMTTRERAGHASCCSSISMVSCGIPIRPMSVKQRRQSSRWRHTTSTKCGLRRVR